MLVLRNGADIEPQAAQFRREFTKACRSLPGPNNPGIQPGQHLDLGLIEPGDEVLGHVCETSSDVAMDINNVGPPGKTFTFRFDDAGRLDKARFLTREENRLLLRTRPPLAATGYTEWPSFFFEVAE